MNVIQNYITSASIVLQPHKDLVGQTAAFLTIAQMLSPLFMFNDMRKAKSTLGMPSMPFLLMALLTTLNLRFAQILNDGAMFNANAVGTAVSVVYNSIYYRFVLPEDKRSHLTKLLGTIVLIVAFIVYSKVEDPAKVETRFGLILTSIMYCFFALPVMGIWETFTKKCTRHLPVPMIITGTLVGFCWLFHGIIINSGFIIAQNLVMSAINLFQLSLFLMYPRDPVPVGKKTKSQKKKSN